MDLRVYQYYGFGSVNLGVDLFALLLVIVSQAINFHHYIVDTCIWKLRKSSTRAAVGIADLSSQ